MRFAELDRERTGVRAGVRAGVREVEPGTGTEAASLLAVAWRAGGIGPMAEAAGNSFFTASPGRDKGDGPEVFAAAAVTVLSVAPGG